MCYSGHHSHSSFPFDSLQYLDAALQTLANLQGWIALFYKLKRDENKISRNRLGRSICIGDNFGNIIEKNLFFYILILLKIFSLYL